MSMTVFIADIKGKRFAAQFFLHARHPPLLVLPGQPHPSDRRHVLR